MWSWKSARWCRRAGHGGPSPPPPPTSPRCGPSTSPTAGSTVASRRPWARAERAPGPHLPPPRRQRPFGPTGPIPATATVLNLLLAGQLPGTFAGAAFGDVDLASNRLTGDASALFGAGKKQLNAPRACRTTGSSSTSAAWSCRKRWTSWRSTTTWCTGASRRPRRRGSGCRSTSANRLCGPKHFAGNRCLIIRWHFK
jgi:hypothetical protein